jgi:hypothetical protein
MRRTGWATTFAGADRRLLSLLIQNPAVDGHRLALGRYGTRVLYSSADDERRIVAIAGAVDRFFDRCEDTVRNTEHSIRCWLRSQIPGRSYKAPFEIPGRKQTITQYRTWWKRMMFTLFRLYRLEDAARDEFLRVQLSDKQREALRLVWASAQVSLQNNSGENNDMEDEEENEDEGQHRQQHEYDDEEEEDDDYSDDDSDADDSDDDDEEREEKNLEEEEEDEGDGPSDRFVEEFPRNSGIRNGIQS